MPSQAVNNEQQELFSKQLRWSELPSETRDRVCQLLAAIAGEIIQPSSPSFQEPNHESRIHSIETP
jgi:hypothetical protein